MEFEKCLLYLQLNFKIYIVSYVQDNLPYMCVCVYFLPSICKKKKQNKTFFFLNKTFLKASVMCVQSSELPEREKLYHLNILYT